MNYELIHYLFPAMKDEDLASLHDYCPSFSIFEIQLLHRF